MVRQILARPGRHLQERHKAAPHRVVERGEAILVLRIHIDAQFDQSRHHVLIAGPHRVVQCRAAAGALQEMALGHEIDIGAGLREQIDQLDRRVERSESSGRRGHPGLRRSPPQARGRQRRPGAAPRRPPPLTAGGISPMPAAAPRVQRPQPAWSAATGRARIAGTAGARTHGQMIGPWPSEVASFGLAPWASSSFTTSRSPVAQATMKGVVPRPVASAEAAAGRPVIGLLVGIGAAIHQHLHDLAPGGLVRAYPCRGDRHCRGWSCSLIATCSGAWPNMSHSFTSAPDFDQALGDIPVAVQIAMTIGDMPDGSGLFNVDLVLQQHLDAFAAILTRGIHERREAAAIQLLGAALGGRDPLIVADCRARIRRQRPWRAAVRPSPDAGAPPPTSAGSANRNVRGHRPERRPAAAFLRPRGCRHAPPGAARFHHPDSANSHPRRP